nr:peptide-methionine (R)-S-oxide reductase MsrB [Haloferula sp. BvORR071]
MKSALPLLVAVSALCASCTAEEKKEKPMETASTAPQQPTGKVEKTEEEWKKILTPEQYRISRQAGTERANGDVYKQFKDQGAGTYYCAACGAELFTSNEKFDSHCGWPSFYDPSKAKNVITKDDYSGGMVRTEVNCAKCGGHLGHVFKGEGFDTPTDQRYCINGTVLKFVPAGGAKPEPKKEEPKKEEPKKDAEKK